MNDFFGGISGLSGSNPLNLNFASMQGLGGIGDSLNFGNIADINALTGAANIGFNGNLDGSNWMAGLGMNQNNNNSWGDWLKNLDYEGIGGVLSGLGNLGQAYMGYKAYGLGEDQLDMQRKALNRDTANQATAYNSRLRNIYDAWQRLNPEGMTETRDEFMQGRTVDGSKVA